MPVVRLPGINLHYLRMDRRPDPDVPGDEVVMVHGLAANLAFWYARLAPTFAASHRSLLFDLRGHGRSTMSASGYSPRIMAEDLWHLLHQLGVTTLHLIGHSFGGLVALHFALRQPQRVRSLTLLDTRIPALQGLLPRNPAYTRQIQPFLERLGIHLDESDPLFSHRLLEEMAKLSLGAPERVQRLPALHLPFGGPVGQRAARHWLRLLEMTSARQELDEDGLSLVALGTLRLPTLAMYGEYSQALPSAYGLRTLWPQARGELVPKAGHFFPLAQPELLIRVWRDFLTNLTQPPCGMHDA